MKKIYEMSMWLQEGPPMWCNSSIRGAQIELLLQVGDPHLYFLVKFHDLMLLIWYVDYQMLDIIGKEEILRNDIDILNSIQGERMLCKLPSDEIIADKENIRSVIWGVD